MFCLQARYCGVSELQAIKDDLGDDFYRWYERLSTLLSLVASLFFVFRLKLHY